MSQSLLASARDLVSRMTLEEKASLLSGRDVWTTRPIPRLGLPSLWLADGPHGVRRAVAGDSFGSGIALPATCFPTLSALGASFDVDLVRRIGVQIGREARALDVDVVLAPGVNLHRSPLGGRNFEYFSEDPLLAGELGAAFVNGVQEEGVGTSLKHYAANDQEHERMSISAEVDMRTLRELHLRPFEIVVTKAQPWTVMCAYNRLNGTYASEHHWLLSEVLREEWGFDGLVVSDWLAVNDRVAGVRAGLHLEMPGSGGVTDADVVAAVKDGRLDEKRVDEVVAELVSVILRAQAAGGGRGDRTPERPPEISSSLAAESHDLAREAAAQSVVLLRNEDGVLPLDPARHRRVAVIGRFAKRPRFQGGGSSQVTVQRVDAPFDALVAACDGRHTFVYAEGTGPKHAADAGALAEAQRVAAEADLALVFVGLPPAMESEGVDRQHMDLPAAHDALVEAVASVQPNVVVVLVAGSPLRLPWADRVRGIVLAGLGGQACGAGLADVLTGRESPSGRLATTWPLRLEDNPSFLNFPGESNGVRYGEGVFVGYRHYDTVHVEPLFPFGHGLSYTRFEWSDLHTAAPAFSDEDGTEVRLRVRNVGSRFGREVVQLYVHDRESRVRRPEQELRAFAKLALAPGEETLVRLRLDRRAFAFWDAETGRWATESGELELRAGASSRDVRLRTSVLLHSTDRVRAPFTRQTPLKRWLADEQAKAAVTPLLAVAMKALGGGGSAAAGSGEHDDPTARAAMYLDLPIAKAVLVTRGAVTWQALDRAIEAANAPRETSHRA